MCYGLLPCRPVSWVYWSWDAAQALSRPPGRRLVVLAAPAGPSTTRTARSPVPTLTRPCDRPFPCRLVPCQGRPCLHELVEELRTRLGQLGRQQDVQPHGGHGAAAANTQQGCCSCPPSGAAGGRGLPAAVSTSGAGSNGEEEGLQVCCCPAGDRLRALPVGLLAGTLATPVFLSKGCASPCPQNRSSHPCTLGLAGAAAPLHTTCLVPPAACVCISRCCCCGWTTCATARCTPRPSGHGSRSWASQARGVGVRHAGDSRACCCEGVG